MTDMVSLRASMLEQAGCYSNGDPDEDMALAERFVQYAQTGDATPGNKMVLISDTDYGTTDVDEDVILTCIEEVVNDLMIKIRVMQSEGSLVPTSTYDLQISVEPVGVRATARMKVK